MKKYIIILIIILISIIISLIVLYNCNIFKLEENKYLTTSILSVFGFIIQIFAIILAFNYGLEANERTNNKIKDKIYDSLSLSFQEYKNEIVSNKGNDVINLIIKNNSNYTIEECIAYITIKDKEYHFYIPDFTYDVLAHSNVNEEKLSWASCENKKHSPRMNIHPEEKQDLLFCINRKMFQDKRFPNDYAYCIEIPSETGYNFHFEGISRCIIENNRNYTFEISLVGKNIKRKNFIIQYIYDKETLVDKFKII